MRNFRFILLVFAAMLFTGCGNNVKLGGKVTFPDGEPLTAGTIIFSNPEHLARSTIKEDGSYDVGSLKAQDGLPPGKYRVYITGAVKVAENITPKKGENNVFEPLIDSRYTHRDTTPLTIEIPGEKVFNITVERP